MPSVGWGKAIDTVVWHEIGSSSLVRQLFEDPAYLDLLRMALYRNGVDFVTQGVRHTGRSVRI